jgi:hypothetical protein
MIREGFEKAENEIFKEGLCQVEDHYVEPEDCKKNREESRRYDGPLLLVLLSPQ